MIEVCTKSNERWLYIHKKPSTYNQTRLSSSPSPMSSTFWSQNHINFAALEDEYNFNANQQQQQQLHQQQQFSFPPQADRYGYQHSSSLQDAFGLNQTHYSSFGSPQGLLSPPQTSNLSSNTTAEASTSYRPLSTYDPEPTHHEQVLFASPSSTLPALDTKHTSPRKGASTHPIRLPKRARDEPQSNAQSAEHSASDHKDAKAKLYVIYTSTSIRCSPFTVSELVLAVKASRLDAKRRRKQNLASVVSMAATNA